MVAKRFIHRNGVDWHGLMVRVKGEVESYWLLRPRVLGRIFLLTSCALGAGAALLVIYALLQPLAKYEGPILSGYVGFLRYELYVNGRPAAFPQLNSVTVASWFLLVFSAVGVVYGVLAAYAVRVKSRRWLVLVPCTTAVGALLVTLLHSLLRVSVYDIVPNLWGAVLVEAPGRVYLRPPKTEYNPVIIYLAEEPALLFMVFNALVAFTAGNLVYMVLTPPAPVRPRRSKAWSAISLRSKGVQGRQAGG